MPVLQAHGITANLPVGFEGRIFRRRDVAGATSMPVAHFASFSLPDAVADFGGGAVTLMGEDDIFAVLFEYGPDSVGKALFARRGMPRSLGPKDFSTILLRRGLRGHAGTQIFFTEGGRPFTFYAVIGSHARRETLVPKVNAVLGSIVVHPRVVIAPGGRPWN
jgi:hypothetical protein